LILGIGSGWFEKDYDEYGYDFTTAGQRLNLLGEYLPRIKSRFGKLNPAPKRDIPMLIGGGGEKKTLRFVAEYANIWHAFGNRQTMIRKSAILDEHCASVGRNPAEIERSTALEGGPAADGGADALAEIGFTLFTVGLSGPDYDLSQLDPWLTWRNQRNS
jgi:alkanesulfonate monooxygenase SsuD/methylene tetrahydromethanopterin reductase-like flavin-dependent oxidoreductase (luciferase family)